MKQPQKLQIQHHRQMRSRLIPMSAPARHYLICTTCEGIHRIEIRSIRYVEAQGNYAMIHYGEEKSIMVSKTLSAVQSVLPVDRFLRVHQSYAVHGSQIRSFVNGTIVLHDGSQIPVSRARKSEVRQWILNSGIRLT
jgi:DNA-binding LytR/AlgR family response regulator